MELTRGMSFQMLDALGKTMYPVLLAHFDWPDAPVYAHSATGDINWNDETWHGVGKLASIDIPSETYGVGALEATFSLAGVSADLDGYGEDAIRGRIANIYFGCLTERPGGWNGKQPSILIPDPILLFSGLMDGLDFVVTPSEKGVINEVRLTVSTGVEARSSLSVYHNDEDQRKTWPNDTAGRHVILAYAKAQKLLWPAN